MMKITYTSIFLAASACLPAAAQAAERFSTEELIAFAMEKNVCGERGVVSAAYENDTSNRAIVTCGGSAAMEFGEGMGATSVAVGGLILLVALAGSDGTPTTTGTN